MKQISAIERLQNLPPIFRGADLTVRFQWTSKTASHYLYLWKRRGLVEGLGGHSDVFANLLVNRHPNMEKALFTAMPSAVIIGVEALRRAGWTTQVPHRPVVAINDQQSVFTTNYFEIKSREPKWFELARAGITGGCDGLPVLSPAWALADMLNEADWGTCGLGPDDIEWSEITKRDEAKWQTACRAFGLAKTKLRSLSVFSRSHS